MTRHESIPYSSEEDALDDEDTSGEEDTSEDEDAGERPVKRFKAIYPCVQCEVDFETLSSFWRHPCVTDKPLDAGKADSDEDVCVDMEQRRCHGWFESFFYSEKIALSKKCNILYILISF